MTLPFQCLAACSRRTGSDYDWSLYSASGSKLTFKSSSGTTSTWPKDEQVVREPEQQDQDQDHKPPEKRRKLSPAAEQKPNFSVLKISNNKEYVVAVTAEDKCIRVFQIDAEEQLQQLTQRCMARRPCSVTLTADDSTILCADKFGDVYALPLLPSPGEEQEQNGALETELKEEKKFAPSATLLTVHSGRNRKTLEEQLKQAEKGPAQSKETPTFKHDLLLGHVSMLTDIACSTIGARGYILTADRDEHIRVSRGPPQAHIIEGFCQGHEEFVSRLCLTKSGQLISGGGDTHLYVWDWSSYQLLQKLPIRDAVMKFYRSQAAFGRFLPEDDDHFKVAVSGIWSVPHTNTEIDEILVACEGVPALFSFLPGFSTESKQALPLEGNALDVAFVERAENTCTAIASIDHLHTPGSTTEIRAQEIPSLLQCFVRGETEQWGEDTVLASALESQGYGATGDKYAGRGDAASDGKTSEGSDQGAADERALRDMLYGVENLRKRPGAED